MYRIWSCSLWVATMLGAFGCLTSSIALLFRHQLHGKPMSVQDAESLQDRVAIGVWFAYSGANYPVNDNADRGISVHLRVCGSWVARNGSDDRDRGVDEWMYCGRFPSQPQGTLDGDAFNRTVDSPNGMIHSEIEWFWYLQTTTSATLSGSSPKIQIYATIVIPAFKL